MAFSLRRLASCFAFQRRPQHCLALQRRSLLAAKVIDRLPRFCLI